jgi:hypothetical protein
MSAPVRRSPVVDDYLDCYASWREEAATVRSAYERWNTELEGDELTAFAAYLAALDREEHAAHVLHEATERIVAADQAALR